MKSFKLKNTKLANSKIIIRKKIIDRRGYLTRLFCFDELKKKNKAHNIKQVNLSLTSKKNTLRGFHYQIKPYNEVKYVTCLKGKVLDIIIDVRKNSKTLLQFNSEIISEDDDKTILIPKGFAHGFLSLVDNCKLLYFHTANYNSKHERGIRYNDPKLNLGLSKKPNHVSEKDKKYKPLPADFKGIEI